VGLFLTREEVQEDLAQVRALFEERAAQMEERLIERLQPRFNVEQELRQLQADLGARIEQMGRILLDKLQANDNAQQEAQQANNVLLDEIRQTHKLEAEIKDALLQHSHSTPRFPAEIYQTPNNVNHLYNRINSLSKQFEILTDVTENMKQLTSQVNTLAQTVALLSPNLPNGEQKHIHEVIEAHTKTIAGAINNILREHSQWLGELLAENDQMKQVLEAAGSVNERSRTRLSPKPQIVEMQPTAIEPAQENHTAEAVEE
jgi:hypothetical protein